MKRWKILSAVLFLALVGSNLFWVWAALDMASAAKYREQERYERTQMLTELRALAPALAAGRSRREVVALAEEIAGEDAFEKDGAVWAGWLGLRFENGRLVEVVPPWGVGADAGPAGAEE